MVCLGILVDTEARTMSVPPEKLETIVQMCAEWQTKPRPKGVLVP